MVRVARRAKTRKQRRVNRKDRRQGQHSIQRQIDEAIADLVRQIIERVLQGQVTDLLGRAKSGRRDLDDMTIVEASCNRCGTRYRRSFYRGGYYERGLLDWELGREEDE